MKRGFGALLVLAGGLAVTALLLSLSQPYAGFRGPVFVDLPKGIGSSEVARRLSDAGVVRQQWQFLLARVFRRTATLQAGEYRFAAPASVWQVYERIAAGDIFYYELTVPEGQNIYDIASSLDAMGVIAGGDFLRSAADPAMIRDIAPEAPSLEGYLFPDTYRITRHSEARELCARMTGRFREAWSAAGFDAPVHATVTLASLIEKETALAGERPLVASVFLNRLRIGMPLDCDPTAIYAALTENRFQGVLYRSDLDSTSRYNTYRHAGLPPGPIANPGLASLRAALEPARTNYLYFVARPDGSGGHSFSAELEAHHRAVQRYRRANQRTQQAGAPERVPRKEPARTNSGGAAPGNRGASRPGF